MSRGSRKYELLGSSVWSITGLSSTSTTMNGPSIILFAIPFFHATMSPGLKVSLMQKLLYAFSRFMILSDFIFSPLYVPAFIQSRGTGEGKKNHEYAWSVSPSRRGSFSETLTTAGALVIDHAHHLTSIRCVCFSRQPGIS